MKNLKKLASIALAAILALTLMVPAFAIEPAGDDSATIVITNPEAGTTYNAYKIFNADISATGRDPETGVATGVTTSYTIAADSPWLAFMTGEGAGAKYVELHSATGTAYTEGTAYVQLKDEVTVGGTTLDTPSQVMAEFVKEALAFAAVTDNNVAADGNVTTGTELAEGATAAIKDLEFGYYAITGGQTMYSLTVDNPEEVVTLKTDKPTVDKTSDKASAQVGEDVQFTVKINVLPGAKDYVLHDAMGSGLTFKSFDGVKVGETVVADTNYTFDRVDDGHTHDTDNDITTPEKACTFTVTFKQDYLDTIEKPTEIVVTYTATVNATAVDEDASTGNTAGLNYGPNDQWSNWDENTPDPIDPDDPDPVDPEIKTYYFDLVKTNSANALLNGAQFKLYDAATAGSEIKLFKTEAGYYRPAVESETTVETIVVTNGQVQIKGLSAEKTYWLEETVAPTGYNLLTDRVEVKLTKVETKDVDNGDGTVTPTEINVGTNLPATVTGTDLEADTPVLGTWTEGGVQVINLTGAELPETGGIGTTIFYTLGGLLVVGAGVLLVVKKRMGAAE